LPKEIVCTNFKDQKEDCHPKSGNETKRDVAFQESNEMTLFQLLSILIVPDLDDAPIKSPYFFIDPLTIPGVNHHVVDPNSPVLKSLTNAFESDDEMIFLDLNFSGVLYQTGGRNTHTDAKLITFTGASPDHPPSYSIPYDNPCTVISSIIDKMCVSSGDNFLSDIVSNQKKHSFGFSPSEGLHRIFWHINNVLKFEVGKHDRKEKLDELLNRKCKVVFLHPKPQQQLPEFLNGCYHISLHIVTFKNVLAPHTFLDNVKNCFQVFRQRPLFIDTDTSFIKEKGLDLAKGLKLVDALFLQYLKNTDHSRWEKEDTSRPHKSTLINEHLGLLQVGKRNFINSITKSKKPRSPRIFFRNKEKEVVTELSHQEICLYCVFIVICYSKDSCRLFAQHLYDPESHILSSYHRLRKFLSF
jgi:hypothetical protein